MYIEDSLRIVSIVTYMIRKNVIDMNVLLTHFDNLFAHFNILILAYEILSNVSNVIHMNCLLSPPPIVFSIVDALDSFVTTEIKQSPDWGVMYVLKFLRKKNQSFFVSPSTMAKTIGKI